MKSHKKSLKSCISRDSVLSSILKQTWTRGCWSYSGAYFCACAAVRFSVSGSRWQSRLSPPQACSFVGKERTKCIKEENRWPITILQLAVDMPHGYRADPRAQKYRVRWSKGSRRFLVLAKQLDDCPRWLSSEELALHFMIVRKPP